ncbi:MAG: zinc ribbon domain-containing protein [Tissierellia bacterium]|nr:zinc ribbon domain-containing protein [Tissierellia bacterium]
MSLLDDLGLSFKKSPEEKKIEETRKLIRQSEEKRNALLSALKEEEQKILESSDEVYKKMGNYIHSRIADVKSSGLMNDQMEVFVKIIEENKEKIVALAEKKDSINARYGEEIDILEASMPTQPKVEEKVENPRKKDCPNCGKANEADASFCGNCGTKL